MKHIELTDHYSIIFSDMQLVRRTLPRGYVSQKKKEKDKDAVYN